MVTMQHFPREGHLYYIDRPGIMTCRSCLKQEALLKTDPSTRLSIANAIFTNQFVDIHTKFIETNKSYYDATVKPVDFDDPRTVGIINGWASDNTNGLIEQVIDQTDPMDLMCLLNAIYFKGIWSSEFDPKNTSP